MNNQIRKKQASNFQPQRLSQARMAKGWSMVDLARQVGLTRQAISSFEKGESNPAYSTLRDLSKSLDVKETFFFLPFYNETELKNESAINFRTLKSAYSKELDQTREYLKLFAEICEYLQEKYIEFKPLKLPNFDIDDFENINIDDIQSYAEKTRRFFGLGDGPISDLTLLLENHGVFVGYLPLPQKIEGVSAWFKKRPYALINSKAYACRARLDLAHELGHLILHRSLAQEDLEDKKILDLVEKQAFNFGMAFLVPEKSIAQEFYGLDINAMQDLKKRWGVSMQAFAMWLNAINLIGDRQKTNFFQKLSACDMRRKEPLDGVMLPERSRAMKRIIELLDSSGTILANDFLTELPYPEYLIKPISNLPDEFFSYKIKENNVVQLITR